MSNSTPTTPMIRTGYMRDGRERKQRAAEFDRWLAAHDAELREQIAAERDMCRHRQEQTR